MDHLRIEPTEIFGDSIRPCLPKIKKPDVLKQELREPKYLGPQNGHRHPQLLGHSPSNEKDRVPMVAWPTFWFDPAAQSWGFPENEVKIIYGHPKKNRKVSHHHFRGMLLSYILAGIICNILQKVLILIQAGDTTTSIAIGYHRHVPSVRCIDDTSPKYTLGELSFELHRCIHSCHVMPCHCERLGLDFPTCLAQGLL